MSTNLHSSIHPPQTSVREPKQTASWRVRSYQNMYSAKFWERTRINIWTSCKALYRIWECINQRRKQNANLKCSQDIHKSVKSALCGSDEKKEKACQKHAGASMNTEQWCTEWCKWSEWDANIFFDLNNYAWRKLNAGLHLENNVERLEIDDESITLCINQDPASMRMST